LFKGCTSSKVQCKDQFIDAIGDGHQQMNNFLNYHAYLWFKALEKDCHYFILFLQKFEKNKKVFQIAKFL